MITVNRIDLKNALTIVKNAISKSSPQAVMRCVNISVSDLDFTLTGANSTMVIRTSIAKNAYTKSKNMDLLIDAEYLASILAKTDDDEVTIQLEGNIIFLKCGNASFKLNTQNIADYPEFDLSYWDLQPIEFTTDKFNYLVNNTVFAVSGQAGRPVLYGVNLLGGDSIVATATDSYRLSRIECPVSSEPFNVVVPADSLKIINKLAAKEEKLNLYVADKFILIVTDSMVCRTLLIDGKYPDTNRLIPSDFEGGFTINRKSLLGSIDRGAIFKADNNIPIFTLTPENDKIVLTTKSSEYGDFREEIDIVPHGNIPTLSFSGIYMLDALKALSDDSISIDFTGELSPFVLHNSETNMETVELLLPVRTYN